MKDKMTRVTDIYNFRPIEDMLSTSDQPTEAQLRAAAAEGYEVIFNLGLHDDPQTANWVKPQTGSDHDNWPQTGLDHDNILIHKVNSLK